MIVRRCPWILLLALTLTACWPQHRQFATNNFVCHEAVEVQEPSYVGVLFPSECWQVAQFQTLETIYGYWSATPETVAAAERALPAALEAAVQNPAAISLRRVRNDERAAELSGEIKGIRDRLGKYRRQYLGITIAGGHHRLLINFFPSADIVKPGTFPYWKERWVTFERGGNWYWQIMYDVRTGAFSEFRSHE